MNYKLLNQHNLEFLSLKEGYTGSSESIYVKMPHCWKSHVAAQMEKINKQFHRTTYFILVCNRLSSRGVAAVYAKTHMQTHLTKKCKLHKVNEVLNHVCFDFVYFLSPPLPKVSLSWQTVQILMRCGVSSRSTLFVDVSFLDSYILTLKAPIATKIVCFSRLLKCLRSLYDKQCGSRSDCLIWVHPVSF